MNITELLAAYERDGVHLWAEGGQLRFRAPKDYMTEARRAELRTHKAAILEHLAAGDAQRALRHDAGNRYEPFPLTDIQAAYLIGRADAYAYGGVACHAYVELSVAELDPERVSAVWRALIARHDMLRVIVHPDGYQRVLPDVPELPISVTDARNEAAVEGVRARLSHRTGPTDRWPLFTLHITHAPGRDLLHMSFDMLVVDHASLRLLIAEFQTLYAGGDLPPLRIGFRDYVLARRALTETPEYARDRAYWDGRLEELPPAPELPTAEGWAAPARATTGPAAQFDGTVRFRRLERTLSADATELLAERARRHGLTSATALLTAYAETVGRWSRASRFTLNVPTVDRLPLHEDIDRVVGDFTSLELLAVDLSEEMPFIERARAIGDRLLEDLEHPLFTGSEVLAELSHRSGSPVLMPVVFTSALGAARSSGDGPGSAGVPQVVGYAVTQTPQVWIDCQVMERGGAIALSWDVREGVLPDGLAEDMFGAWTALVERLAGEEEVWTRPAEVPLPAAQAERRAWVNATAHPLPDALLHEPVFARARRTPDAVAVRTTDRVLTYRALAARAAEVAARLRAAGLRPAEPVAIWMDKGWEQVVAVLGTLLAGGAYLPVDTAQPAARRDAILSDAGVRLLLTQSWLAEAGDLPDTVTALAVDDLPEGVVPADTPPRAVSPDDLAYVIYTSGSTGSPKGVMISHRAALNTIEDINRRHDIGADDRILGVAGLGFDLSVWDLFGTLSAGGVLVLPDAERRGDPSHWADLITGSGVTVWNSVPGQLQMLCDWLRPGPALESSRLRLALLSGDWIPVTLPDQARAILPGLEIVALGGATEGSIWSIAHPVDEVDVSRPSIPYGRPLANQSFHVLDQTMRPCPDWVPGELYIGGAGVALGYLGDDARTAERFVTEPETGARVYRTGDIGRYLPDGSIEFLGREDAQVKIRGYRVELAEIEAAVQSHPAVAAAAVVVDDSAPGGRRLAAFVETGRRERDEIGSGRAAAVHEAAAQAVREASAAVDAARLTEFLDALDDVALSVMARLLEGTGLFTGDTPRTAEEICAALRATPRHRHVIRRWLSALAARDRLIHDDAGSYRGLRPAAADPEQAWRQATDLGGQVGWSTGLLDVMRLCADRLPELISGEIDIRALLFPGADLSAADAAYRDNLAIRHLNQAVVAALREVAAGHVGEERLRVLEIGGGVGGTTGELVPMLADYGVDYLFTDPSPFFLNEARERFADHPWVRYERFDVDREIRDQGFTPNSFDVVICANTLHAATDVDAAMSRLRELLVPGGHLVFVENTRDDHPPLLVSMEFLEVADRAWTDLRAANGQSFLTRPQWLDLLDRHGAADVTSLPTPDDPLAATGQEAFLARMKTDRIHVTVGELVRQAANRLPEYMLPAVWQVLDAMPRTANGKTDRARLLSWLPRETPGIAAALTEQPMDELESRLAELWAELMSLERVGRDDDFFALGGDSLLVARMVGRLRERVPQAAALEWEVVLRHMLRRPTVAGLAAFLRGLTGIQVSDAAPGAPVSPVVHLHGSGAPDEPTTVLVHAGTGTVMPYRALITEIRRRSPGTATVVGLEIPGLDRFLGAQPEGLIERLAADYARALLDGGCRRFHVVGYCLGGLIATEVARNLAESGAEVESLTAISSHSPRFRLDDELLAEYSFAVMMGIDPADLGFPADEYRVAAAADAVLAGSPGVLPDGGLAALTGEYADVATCFREMAGVPRAARIARMCEAVPASAGTYAPDHMTRLFLAFRQSVFAITRYDAEPYAGDITFLRHSGAYPFPGSKDAVTEYWEELTLGDLRILDIGGDHFSCLSVEHSPAVLKLLDELTDGVVTR
ncbi:amino acid adenylation domain-containing protein [Actinoallomurus spadix]|uniref:Phenyloxazoline synthase MbtB n=1 Tax=Actinoallomurus spadix TaxID=79912 RepID=A0ABN0WE82_9ACTN|nr:non-ribosomal peptide synthetase [Actinoallomurus spadix]MCO5987222.1 amino acid adenylation domain-containing protein [Actinoallomurus spadix]